MYVDYSCTQKLERSSTHGHHRDSAAGAAGRRHPIPSNDTNVILNFYRSMLIELKASIIVGRQGKQTFACDQRAMLTFCCGDPAADSSSRPREVRLYAGRIRLKHHVKRTSARGVSSGRLRRFRRRSRHFFNKISATIHHRV